MATTSCSFPCTNNSTTSNSAATFLNKIDAASSSPALQGVVIHHRLHQHQHIHGSLQSESEDDSRSLSSSSTRSLHVAVARVAEDLQEDEEEDDVSITSPTAIAASSAAAPTTTTASSPKIKHHHFLSHTSTTLRCPPSCTPLHLLPASSSAMDLAMARNRRVFRKACRNRIDDISTDTAAASTHDEFVSPSDRVHHHDDETLSASSDCSKETLAMAVTKMKKIDCVVNHGGEEANRIDGKIHTSRIKKNPACASLRCSFCDGEFSSKRTLAIHLSELHATADQAAAKQTMAMFQVPSFGMPNPNLAAAETSSSCTDHRRDESAGIDMMDPLLQLPQSTRSKSTGRYGFFANIFRAADHDDLCYNSVAKDAEINGKHGGGATAREVEIGAKSVHPSTVMSPQRRMIRINSQESVHANLEAKINASAELQLQQEHMQGTERAKYSCLAGQKPHPALQKRGACTSKYRGDGPESRAQINSSKLKRAHVATTDHTQLILQQSNKKAMDLAAEQRIRAPSSSTSDHKHGDGARVGAMDVTDKDCSRKQIDGATIKYAESSLIDRSRGLSDYHQHIQSETTATIATAANSVADDDVDEDDRRHHSSSSTAQRNRSDSQRPTPPLYKLRPKPKPNWRIWRDRSDIDMNNVSARQQPTNSKSTNSNQKNPIHCSSKVPNSSEVVVSSSSSNHVVRGFISTQPSDASLNRSSTTSAVVAPITNSEQQQPLVCTECGKAFWSRKALFGHMRCHPERQWRGIQKPSTITGSLTNANKEPDQRSTTAVRSAKKLAKSSPQVIEQQTVSNIEASVNIVAGVDCAEYESDADKKTVVMKASDKREAKIRYAKPKSRRSVSAAAAAAESSRNSKDDQQVFFDSSAKKALIGTKRTFTDFYHETLSQSTSATNYQDQLATLAPINWPTRKRTRRSRSEAKGHYSLQPHEYSEPALSSDTATNSSDFVADQPKLSTEDQEDFDMASCLVLLSAAGSNKMEIQKEEENFMIQQQTKEACSRDTARYSRSSKQMMVVGVSEFDYNASIAASENATDSTDENVDDDGADTAYTDEEKCGVGDTENWKASMVGRYECSTCKKSFSSHQALGGHRASHRKAKGCSARTTPGDHCHGEEEGTHDLQEEELHAVTENVTSGKDQAVVKIEQQDTLTLKHTSESVRITAAEAAPLDGTAEIDTDLIQAQGCSKISKRKLRSHECSICYRVFPSGQALGGHKRCHWAGADQKMGADTASVASNSNNNNSGSHPQEQADNWVSVNIASISTSQDQVPSDVAQRNKNVVMACGHGMIDLNLPAPLDELSQYDDAAAAVYKTDRAMARGYYAGLQD